VPILILIMNLIISYLGVVIKIPILTQDERFNARGFSFEKGFYVEKTTPGRTSVMYQNITF